MSVSKFSSCRRSLGAWAPCAITLRGALQRAYSPRVHVARRSPLLPKRSLSQNAGPKDGDQNNTNMLIYMGSVAILVIGLSYASVPLYRMFCQVVTVSSFPLSFLPPFLPPIACFWTIGCILVMLTVNVSDIGIGMGWDCETRSCHRAGGHTRPYVAGEEEIAWQGAREGDQRKANNNMTPSRSLDIGHDTN